MIDDVLYFSTPSNRIIALDAGTRREIWQFDPQVRHPGPRQFHKHRGVAYLQNESASDRRILFGSLRRTIDRWMPQRLRRCDFSSRPPREIIYFKLYKRQLPVVEQALETTALMLGSDKSGGYCLEMICADFLAWPVTQENQWEVLVLSLNDSIKFCLTNGGMNCRSTPPRLHVLTLPSKALYDSSSKNLFQSVRVTS